MALVFEYSDPDELYTAQMEAVDENTCLHLEYEMQKVQMEHELRLHDIETRALLENYSDDILEALYEKEMELFMEAEEGIIQKILNWIGNIVKAILGIKPENPEAMVTIAEPEEIKGLGGKVKAAARDAVDAIKNHKVIAAFASVASIAAVVTAVKKIKEGKNTKEMKASEAEQIKNNAINEIDDATKEVTDAAANGADKDGVLQKFFSEVLIPAANTVKSSATKVFKGNAKEGEEQQNSGNENNGNAENGNKDNGGNAENKDTNGNAENQNAGNNQGKETNNGKGNNGGKKGNTQQATDKAPESYNKYNVKGTENKPRSISFTTAPNGIDQSTWNTSLMAKHIVDNSSVFANKVREIEQNAKFTGKAADKGNIKSANYRKFLKANSHDTKFNKVLDDAAIALDNPNTGKVFTNKNVKIFESTYECFVIESAYTAEDVEEAPEENVEMMDAFEMAELSFSEDEEKSFEDMLEESAATNEDLEELNKLLENL